VSGFTTNAKAHEEPLAHGPPNAVAAAAVAAAKRSSLDVLDDAERRCRRLILMAGVYNAFGGRFENGLTRC
jgi:predicted methyltransferase